MDFLNLNKSVSLRFERAIGLFPDRAPLIEKVVLRGAVADPGGGKKPYLADRPNHLTYVGLDIDEEELKAAPPGIYTSTMVVDITKPGIRPEFDVIICRFVLEHVHDTEAALQELSKMMRPGEICYISAPCRHAVFAKLNLIIPQGIKKKYLGKLYPSKESDGFPVRYDRLSPSEISDIVEKIGATVSEVRKVYFSGYFTFFFPLHIAWRLFSVFQYYFIADYCERFEIIFKKDSNTKYAAN